MSDLQAFTARSTYSSLDKLHSYIAATKEPFTSSSSFCICRMSISERESADQAISRQTLTAVLLGGSEPRLITVSPNTWEALERHQSM